MTYGEPPGPDPHWPDPYPPPQPGPGPYPPPQSQPDGYPPPQPQPGQYPPQSQPGPTPYVPGQFPAPGPPPGTPPPADPGQFPLPALPPVTPPPSPGPRRSPAARRWLITLAGLAALVLLVSCGVGVYFLIQDERKGPPNAAASPSTGTSTPTPSPTPSPSPKKRDISTRAVDPVALTEQEVFPSTKISVDRTRPPYTVVKTQALADCRQAATAELGATLVNLGCDQAVRATLTSPDGTYVVTAGIFNLDTTESAQTLFKSIQGIISGGKGALTGLPAGGGTDVIATAPAWVGWEPNAHFFSYCMITQADGKGYNAQDTNLAQIIYDLVNVHLSGVVSARTKAN